MRDAALPLLDTLADAMPANRPIVPLEVAGLTVRRDGRALLDGLELSLGAHGVTAIMGPNGAGKSLLLRCLHGLVMPDAGAMSWNGLAPEAARHRQALVFQKPVLLRRSVAANVDFVLKARGADLARRAVLLEHVGLLAKAGQPARLLSGGEAQRLALARALATGPDVLLLDEPTASLDPASTQMIEEILKSVAQHGVRVLIVTHDAHQARRIADDVVFVSKGRVVEHSPATDFFPKPGTALARAYLEGAIIP